MSYIEIECPLRRYELTQEEERLLDQFAVAYAHCGYSPESVYGQAMWCLANRRAVLSSLPLPDRYQLAENPPTPTTPDCGENAPNALAPNVTAPTLGPK